MPLLQSHVLNYTCKLLCSGHMCTLMDKIVIYSSKIVIATTTAKQMDKTKVFFVERSPLSVFSDLLGYCLMTCTRRF